MSKGGNKIYPLIYEIYIFKENTLFYIRSNARAYLLVITNLPSPPAALSTTLRRLTTGSGYEQGRRRKQEWRHRDRPCVRSCWVQP
jgi:hypothetical protein